MFSNFENDLLIVSLNANFCSRQLKNGFAIVSYAILRVISLREFSVKLCIYIDMQILKRFSTTLCVQALISSIFKIFSFCQSVSVQYFSLSNLSNSSMTVGQVLLVKNLKDHCCCALQNYSAISTTTNITYFRFQHLLFKVFSFIFSRS